MNPESESKNEQKAPYWQDEWLEFKLDTVTCTCINASKD